MNTNFHTESRMRENCTYGSMRGRAHPTGASRSTLHPLVFRALDSLAGEPLVKPSEPWDSEHAHKPWVIKHDGVVYHFYNAVGSRGRGLALATSVDMKTSAGSN